MFDRYAEFEGLLAALQVVLVMLGMGATLTATDFVSVVKQPRSLVVGGLCQFALAPGLTVLTIWLCGLEPGIAVGLILISAMPGGPLANLFTFLAQGNVALSIALTGVATFGALLFVPFLLTTFARGHVPADLAMPADRIVLDVTVYLIVPLLAGMALLRVSPVIARRLSIWFIRAGLLVLAGIVVGSLGSGRIEPLGFGWKTPIVITLLCVAIQNLSMAPYWVLRWPVADQTAVGIGVTIRNINLALLLAARMFPASDPSAGAIAGGVLYVVLFWGALSLVVGSSSVYFQRRAMASP